MNEKTKIGFQNKNFSVTDLIIWGNEIDTIQDELVAFPNLKSINLRHEDKEIIPEWLTQRKSFKTIYFCHKTPRYISALKELTQLEGLFLENYHLTDLSMILESLVHLKNLDLSFNDLDHIPEVIQNYPELEHLYLGNNVLFK